MILKSPITNSDNVKHISSYDVSIMSDSRIIEQPVNNYICLDTGLIFNASGPRGLEKDFYSDEYDLHSESDDSEFKYFESEEPTGIYDDITSFISSTVNLKEASSILDIGCGKGILLNKLSKVYADSSLNGVEPSKSAQKFYQRNLPHINCFGGVFEDSPYINQTLDLIVSNGVLEHVPHPVEFMKKIRNALSDEGYAYIGVPNFLTNAADLFTYDHLSRFTPQTVEAVFNLAGFKIVASKISHRRVPMWFILKPTNPTSIDDLQVNVKTELKCADHALEEIKAFFDTYNKAAVSAQEKQKKVAVYGAGTFALIGTKYTKLKNNLVKYIMDDNSSIWGSERVEISIVDPISIKDDDDISEVVISANACYLDLFKKKTNDLLKDSLITFHVPKIK